MALPLDPQAPKRSRPRGAKILAILGAVLLVLGFVGTTAGIGRVRVHVKAIRDTGPNLRNTVIADLNVPGSRRVELEPGSYDVFAISTYGEGFRRSSTTTTTRPGRVDEPTGPFSNVGLDEPEITLTDPAGKVLVAREPGVGSIFAGVSGEMYAVATYRVVEGGTYRLSAAGGNAAEVGIAPSVTDREVTRLVGSGLLTLVAALGMGLGFLLGLIGGIWLLVAGSSPAPPAPQPGWGPAAPPTGIWPAPGPPTGPPARWPAAPPTSPPGPAPWADRPPPPGND